MAAVQATADEEQPLVEHHGQQHALQENQQAGAEAAVPGEEQPQRPAGGGCSTSQPHTQVARQLTGLVLLLAVSVLWSTWTPAVRLIYSLPGPPSPWVLAAVRGMLQLLLLLSGVALSGSGCTSGQQDSPLIVTPSSTQAESVTAAAAEPHQQAVLVKQGPPSPPAAQPGQQDGEESGSAAASAIPDGASAIGTSRQRQGGDAELAPEAPAMQGAAVVIEEGPEWPVAGPAARLLELMPAPLLAALEIGLYNTTGTLAQTAGLSMTMATRAAFLVQASVLFTPALAAAAGMVPSRQAVLGSVLALAGTAIIALDAIPAPEAAAEPQALLQPQLQLRTATDSTAALAADSAMAAAALDTAAMAAATNPAFSAAGASPLGDGLILFAALCYSGATVRIPVWAVRRSVTPLQLALGKSAVLAAASVAALGLEATHLAAEGQQMVALWPGWRQPEGWAIMLWTALGPGALAAILHVKGQSLISPTAAQLMFCSVPLFSALLSALLLPDEPVGTGTWAGGAVVAAGGLVAALPAAWRRRT